jgi:hypothetical protein
VVETYKNPAEYKAQIVKIFPLALLIWENRGRGEKTKTKSIVKLITEVRLKNAWISMQCCRGTFQFHELSMGWHSKIKVVTEAKAMPITAIIRALLMQKNLGFVLYGKMFW